MIKCIDEKDISACVEVIKESFMTVANEFDFTIGNAPGFVAFSMCDEKLRSHCSNKRRLMYAFYDADKIVDFYSLALLNGSECELNHLSVLPSYRHQKIGEKLLLHSFSEAKKANCEVMKIGIVEENVILRKWYEKYDFVHTKAEKFDFFPCPYQSREIRLFSIYLWIYGKIACVICLLTAKENRISTLYDNIAANNSSYQLF